MLSNHAPNPERERIARLMEEYERSHTVTTTPILTRDKSASVPGAEKARNSDNRKKAARQIGRNTIVIK